MLIAGDQPLIRRGMALLLAAEADIEVVGQAADGPGSLLPLVFAPVCSRSSAGA